MAQDWFTQNAPQQPQKDWFSANAPKGDSLTDNPNDEGLYRMAAPDKKGTFASVPFSRVKDAQQQGYKFQDTSTGDRWHKDYQATLPLTDKLKDRYQYGTRDVAADGSDSDGNVLKAAVQNIGGRAGRVLVHTAAHPIYTVVDLAKTAADVANPARVGPPQFVKDAYRNIVDSPDRAAAVERTLGDLGGNLLLGELGGEAGPRVAKVAGDARAYATDAAIRAARGGKVDEIIPGDTVTPQQRFDAAKGMGVNLDLAQATNGTAARMAKRPSEHSLGGSPEFEANNAANVEALNQQVGRVLDKAHPQAVTREQLGSDVQAALKNDQTKMQDVAGEIYQNIDDYMRKVKPDMGDIRDVAKDIRKQYSGYYDKNPEMLSGGSRRAWEIVQKLAADDKPVEPTTVQSPIVDGSGKPFERTVKPAAKPKNTWTDLHNYRSDLLDITRGPDFVGDRATGWLERLTGAIDGAMTNPKTMDPHAMESFRAANDVYSRMKALYDTPQSKFYHLSRAADGTRAASMLDSLTPQEFQHIQRAAPELTPAIRRYTMQKIFTPAGNEIPQLDTLPSRWNRAQKEQMAGVLTPEQIHQLDDVARVSRMVKLDSNPSGSGKVMQAVQEGRAMVAGPAAGMMAAVSGHPVAGALAAVAPYAEYGATKGIAKLLTNPKVVERVMRGPDAWAARGAKNLVDAGADATAVETLKNTSRGRRLLMDAGDVAKNSRAMRAILARMGNADTGNN